MNEIKIKTLCSYRKKEQKNNYTIELCEVKNGNKRIYAIYTLQQRETKCITLNTNYNLVKNYFKKIVTRNM